MEGGGIPPTRTLSLLLPKGEALLFKLIKNPFSSGRKGGTSLSFSRPAWREEEKKKVMFDRLEPESESNFTFAKKSLHECP